MSAKEENTMKKLLSLALAMIMLMYFRSRAVLMTGFMSMCHCCAIFQYVCMYCIAFFLFHFPSLCAFLFLQTI